MANRTRNRASTSTHSCNHVLADISRSPLRYHVHRLTIRTALRCHNNETRAPIANPPNSAQLGGTPYHSRKLHPGPCCSVGVRPRTDTHRETETQTHRREWPIYISRRPRLTRNVTKWLLSRVIRLHDMALCKFVLIKRLYALDQ